MYGSKEPTCPFFSVYSLTEILDAGYPDALIVCTRFCCQITWTLYNNLEMLKCRAQTRSSAFDKWLPKFGIVLTIIFRLLFCFSRMFSWKATKLGGFHPPMGQPRSNSSGLHLYRLVSIIKIASNILFLLKNKLILVNHRHRQFVPPHPFCLSHIFLSFYCFFFFLDIICLMETGIVQAKFHGSQQQVIVFHWYTRKTHALLQHSTALTSDMFRIM